MRVRRVGGRPRRGLGGEAPSVLTPRKGKSNIGGAIAIHMIHSIYDYYLGLSGVILR